MTAGAKTGAESESPIVLVLAGGLGTRLRPLTETVPKALVPVLRRPFLEHLLRRLLAQGFRRYVLSVGYLGQQIREHFEDGAALGCELGYSVERSPLGTGGAIAHALDQLGQTFVVVNGDTLLELDLQRMVRQHRSAGLWVTLAAAQVSDRSRYGALHLEQGRVTRFEEKRPGLGPGAINGGVYVMERELFSSSPAPPFSLERDLLPRWVGRIGAFETHGFFVDMGTHEALAGLERALARLQQDGEPRS